MNIETFLLALMGASVLSTIVLRCFRILEEPSLCFMFYSQRNGLDLASTLTCTSYVQHYCL